MFLDGGASAVLRVHRHRSYRPIAADCADDWSLNFDGLAERFHVFAATNRAVQLPKEKHNMDLTVNHVRRHI
jgi:hypothetical protein